MSDKRHFIATDSGARVIWGTGHTHEEAESDGFSSAGVGDRAGFIGRHGAHLEVVECDRELYDAVQEHGGDPDQGGPAFALVQDAAHGPWSRAGRSGIEVYTFDDPEDLPAVLGFDAVACLVLPNGWLANPALQLLREARS